MFTQWMIQTCLLASMTTGVEQEPIKPQQPLSDDPQELNLKTQTNFWQTKLTLADGSKQVAIFHHPSLTRSDHWTLEIIDPVYFVQNNINPCFLYPSAQTAAKLRVDPAPLLAILEEVRPLIEGVTPTDEDTAYITAYLNPYLQKLEQIPEDAYQETLVLGYQYLSQMFYSAQLTQGQKAALYQIMESFALNLS